MIKDIKTYINNKAIWIITYPIMIGMLSQTLITLVDTAFLGRLGEVELGAASMAGIYYYFFTTLAWGFAIGVQIIIARRFGEGNNERINIVMQHGIIFMLLFGSLLFVAIMQLTEMLMSSFVASKDIYRVSVEFIEYRKFGIFFASINFLFRSFYIGISNPKSIAHTTICMTAVNITFNSLLIFGSPFNAPMGVAGAAIASVMAEMTATAYFIIYTVITKPVKLKIFNKFSFEMDLMKRILSVSFPTMCQKFVSYGAWLAFFLIIEKIGERALAVTVVCRSVYMIVGIPTFSFAATANTLTSRLIGEGNRAMVRPTLLKITRFSLICVTVIGALVAMFPEAILMVYTDNTEIIKESIPIIYLICFIQYAMGSGLIYFEGVSGTGNTAHALIIEIVVLFGYLIVAWYFAISIDAGAFWVWTSEFVYGFLCLVLSAIYIYKYNWGSKKI